LDKAELYSKRAIEITPTLPKPENLTEEAFNNAKSDTLVMAHGGLGLVYIRRGKFSEAIPELEQSVRADTIRIPTRELLPAGIADKQTRTMRPRQPHSLNGDGAELVAAACKSSAEEAKKQGSTQLSAPN